MAIQLASKSVGKSIPLICHKVEKPNELKKCQIRCRKNNCKLKRKYSKKDYTEEEKEKGTYSGLSSGSNNYAVTNPKLEERINEDIKEFLKENPTVSKSEIPSDIITASGSGLDPHITVEAANVQIDRIVKNNNISEKKIKELIEQNTKGKLFGIFGEETVNVLNLNLSLLKELNNK